MRFIYALFLTLLSSFAFAFPSSIFSQLDFGLYWFSYNNNYCKASSGSCSSHYDPTKPTLIYVHGWQPGTTVDNYRENFYGGDYGGPNVDTAVSWLNEGYNVGIFYWNQFADELEVKYAEAKIWVPNGPKNMRYLLSNGIYQNYSTLSSMSELMSDEIASVMSSFSGSRFVIAGHSLGSQMALTVAEDLTDSVNANSINSNLLPDRVSLLDPFHSNGAKSYLNDRWPGEVTRDIVDKLKANNIAIDAYRSSAATSTIFIGDENIGLLNKVAFVELKPWYFWAWQQTEKHIAAKWHYLWSHAFSPTDLKDSGEDGLSASTSDTRVRILMNKDFRLVQDQGEYSRTPEDDRHFKASRL
ncbi:hypothetical protein [Microbulbifer sp. TYP-18]|uniref:lipase family protein n=1 Tax=Microbulbifer sp. TYP-18 TaxID=3230024 RepID=UPI0034C666A5